MTLSGWPGRLIGIFTTALVIRAVFVLTLQDGFYFPDSVDYSKAAVNLITSGEFGQTYRRSPLYPLFLAGIYALVGEQIVAVRLIEAVLGACLALAIALLARRVGGDTVGALAGLLWGLYPMGVFIAGLVYPTQLATLLLACAMLCVVPAAKLVFAPARLIGGGMLLGLTALTVPVALVTIPVMTLWMMYWHHRRRLRLAALVLVGAALPLVPWTVRNYDVHDRLVIIDPNLLQLLPTVAKPSSTGNPQRESPGSHHSDKIDTILAHPAAFARRFMREFRSFWELYPQRIRMDEPHQRARMLARDERVVQQTAFTTSRMALVSVLSVGPMFLFGLIGTGAMWVHKKRRAQLSLFCATILSFAVTYSAFWSKTRYRVPIEPYILILSAYGLWQVGRALARLVSRSAVPAAPHALTTSSAVGHGHLRPGEITGERNR
jgi:4-amino-4-deoxy-L-arabinose transferase-like glycosyltransferase